MEDYVDFLGAYRMMSKIKKDTTMTRIGFMTSLTSTTALRVGSRRLGAAGGQKSSLRKDFADLKSVDGVSILGQHDGVMDDDLLALLEDDAA